MTQFSNSQYQGIAPPSMTWADAEILQFPTTTEPIAQVITRWADRYQNRSTRRHAVYMIAQLFAQTGRTAPDQLTEADVLAWITSGTPANNTVYQRASKARTFVRWCQRQGLMTNDPTADLRDLDSPLRSYRRTYGKVQSKHPGRWLTHDEAYVQLLGACQDGTTHGLRDEIVIRLGLAGMRIAEIRALELRHLANLPTITWTGKGRKPRQATAGTGLVECLTRYLAIYRQHAGSLTEDLPLICPGTPRTRIDDSLNWGHRAGKTTLFKMVTNRAATANLGHVAPHDLRRSAAGILHNATDEHGAHHFDLLDIQKVLGHSDPATTMRSYLEPMQTEVLDRAARYLD